MTRKRVDVLDVSAGATAQAGKARHRRMAHEDVPPPSIPPCNCAASSLQGEFSVMTYGCVTDLAARGVSYRHIKPDFLKWEHR